MRLSSFLSCVIAALWIGCVPSGALAQTQVQSERLEEIAQYTVVGGICSKIGFKVADDIGERIGPAVEADIDKWGGDTSRLKAAALEAVSRQSRTFEIDFRFLTDKVLSGKDLSKIKDVFVRYGPVCESAARDTIFKTFISMPVNYDLDKAATAASDALLEDGGEASWQTPPIAARGNLMVIAGACRGVIGPESSNVLRQSYGKSDDPRARAFYDRSFDSGLNDTELKFDKAQCQRAISHFRQKIAALR